MSPSCRLLAITATVLVVGACNSSGDDATLRISLGSSLQALAVDAITIARYELEVTCVDGSKTTHAGDIGDDGSFEAEVPNCPQATIRFRGLTNARMPALDGQIAAAIRAPATDVTIPVRRVGSVIIVNDDDYTSVCKIAVANAPEYDRTFELSAGASRKEVVPVNGTTLSCAPADVCSLVACDFAGPLATTRTVAVSFGGESTISLANLTNSLVFTIAPPSSLIAGVQWTPFSVSLVDERGVPINRSDVFVNLVADTSTAHGGFQNGIEDTSAGAAFFPFVTFTTAGVLTMRATADVDGVTLSSAPVVVDILPDVTALLELVGPVSATAGVAIDLTVSGTDQFGNPTSAPSSLILSSTDPLSPGSVITNATAPVMLRTIFAAQAQAPAGTTFMLFTAGLQTITARSSLDPAVKGTLVIDVAPGIAVSLDLVSSAARLIPGQSVTLVARAQDTWGNTVPSYTGTVALNASPATDFAYGGPHAFTAADAGVFAFTASFATVNSRIVQATDGTLTSTGIGVEVIGATQLDRFVFTMLPSTPIRAGTNTPVTLMAVNAAGEVLESFWDLVDVRADGCETTTFNFYGYSGVRSQDIVCRTAGTWSLIANYAYADVGVSAPITVVAGPPYRLVLVQDPPTTVLVGQPFLAAFRLEDIDRNTADPTEHVPPITLTLNEAGITLGGTAPVIVNNVLTYPALTVSGPGGDFQVQASTTGLEVNSAATTYFTAAEGTGCSVAYVRPGGTGDGCSIGTAAATISAALQRVDDGGKVLVAVGSYAEQVVIDKTVVLRGGYDISFGEVTRNPLASTKIQPPADTASAVRTGGSITATIDGFFIAAAAPLGSRAVISAVDLDGGATVTLENNRILGPVVDSTIGQTAAIEINSAPYVTIRNNWIHTGGRTTGRAVGARRGILAGTSTEPSSPTVTIVGNTLYVASADTGEALFHQGVGDYRVTNNLIVGDFSTCDDSTGVCAIREQMADTNSIASIQSNLVLQANGPDAFVYMDYSGNRFTSLDGFGGARTTGNVNIVGGVPQAALVRFTASGTSFETDDWHLFSAVGYTVGRDATAMSCGSDAKASCGGNGLDIDGQARTSPICVGADELD